MKVLTEYERGFIEAAIDTDGCLTLFKTKAKSKRGYYPKFELSFSNNSIEYLKKILAILGQTHRKLTLKKGSLNYKVSFRHGVLKWLLPQLILVVKEKKQQVIIEYFELQGNKKYPNSLTNPCYEKMLKQLVDSFLII